MKRFIPGKVVYILLLLVVLCTMLSFPQPCHAWGAVTNESWLAQIFTGLKNLGVSQVSRGYDVNTHVRLMTTAYQYLRDDPALDTDCFPPIEEIESWDKVYVKNAYRAVVHGGEWQGKKGGPDAGGKTRDSEHYYNPLLNGPNKGGGPDAVKEYYTILLEELDNTRDLDKGLNTKYDTLGGMVLRLWNATSAEFWHIDDKGYTKYTNTVEKLNQAAAWSAHFLADMHVPYHVVGVPAPPNAKLSGVEFGEYYLWGPGKMLLEEDTSTGTRISIDLSSNPPEGWGLGGDFSAATAHFMDDTYSEDSTSHDWFDPWYSNGFGLGIENVETGVGSHASWEAWAHKRLVEGAMLVKPDSYSTDWKNATPSFGGVKQNMYKQADQVDAFTEAAAIETRKNMPAYLKHPELGANKAIQRIATLWRSSLTALRPSIEGKRDEENPKLLNVIATVSSVEPGDPAVNVKAKLTVEGGTIRGDAIHYADKQGRDVLGRPVNYDPDKTVKVEPVEVAPFNSWITEWQVDSDNPDACELKLEVICEYQKTPDLQYAVCEQLKPVKVSISPDQAEAGDKVTLTVKVDPPKKTELEIGQFGPLEVKKPKVTTDNKGEFKGDFTVHSIVAGKRQVSVFAPKLGEHGYAILTVVDNKTGLTPAPGTTVINLLKHKTCTISFRVTDAGAPAHLESRYSKYYGCSFKGSFTGNTFTGTCNNKQVGFEKRNEIGKITVTIAPTDDPTIWKITSYAMQAQYQSTPWIIEYIISGKTPMELIKHGGMYTEFNAYAEGNDACKYINNFKRIGTGVDDDKVVNVVPYKVEGCRCNEKSSLGIRFSY